MKIHITRCSDNTEGILEWDPSTGSVEGFMAEELAYYGQEAWMFSPLSIGDSTRPALTSNDGMIALLFSLNCSTPDLTVERVPRDLGPPGRIN